MSGDRFFDSNILIYAFARNASRSEPAGAFLAEGGLIGVQVLNEFVNVSRRKMSRPARKRIVLTAPIA